MHYWKLPVVSSIAAILLVACGGGSTSSGTSSTFTLTPPPSFANTVTSGLAFPLEAALRDSTKQGSTTSYTVAGDCTGTAIITSSVPTPATFEGGAALAVSNALSMTFTSNNCPLISSSSYSKDYFDSSYLPLGTSSVSGGYGLFLTVPVIPASVKVGDVGTIGTKNYYSNSSKTVAAGYDILSYVIEPDTANTAIVNLINKSFDQNGVLYYAEQSRYKIWSNGAIVPVSSDVQTARVHLVMTVVPDTIGPTVVSSTPGNGATSVPGDINITATFSELIDPVTLDASSLTLRSASGANVAGTITYSGNTVTFVPSAYLVPGTSYTFTISAGVKDLAGNTMASSYSVSFVSEAPYLAAPAVGYTTPANLTHLVPVTTAITAHFSLNGRLNPATISNATFYLMDGSVSVPGTVTFDSSRYPFDVFATFTPSAPLNPDVVYTATVTTGVQDIQGNHMASNYSWSFVTDTALLNDPIFITDSSIPYGAAIGDVTGDGRNDVVVANGTSGCNVTVFAQNANGGLDAPISYPLVGLCSPIGLAIGDVNHDGKTDVVVGNGNGGIQVFTQNASGGLNGAVVYASSDTNRIRVADVNNDGLMDVIGGGAGVSVWLQNASGTLNAPQQFAFSGLTVSDLDVGDANNDGLNDVVASLYSATLSLNSSTVVIPQQAGGTLNTPVSYDIGKVGPTKGLAVGDINGDGLNEIAFAYFANINNSKVGVFYQNALGTYNPPVPYDFFDFPAGLKLADMTGDGRMDVVVISSLFDFKIGGFKQMPDGTLQSLRQYATANTQIDPLWGQFAVGDINGDGKVDVVIPNFSSNLAIYYHK